MNFCGDCGSRLDSGSKFCANCGAAVEQVVLDQAKQIETTSGNKTLYISVGISALITILYLFATWFKSSNGGLSTFGLLRAISNIEKLASELRSYGIGIDGSDLTILKIGVIIGFVIPILNVIYIKKSLSSKEIDKKFLKVSGIIGIIICLLWLGLSAILADSYAPYLIVAMRSGDVMDFISSSIYMSSGTSPAGFAQYLIPLLLIANIITTRRKTF